MVLMYLGGYFGLSNKFRLSFDWLGMDFLDSDSWFHFMTGFFGNDFFCLRNRLMGYSL